MKELKTPQIISRLETKFNNNEWLFIQQVANRTGPAACYADALALNLWKSRGAELYGFEIKASRADWLRELNNPAKAERFVNYCDRWWIVVGHKDIVKPGELPAGWGLMIPHSRGLTVSVKAAKRKTEPLDRLMLAAILRRWRECTSKPQAIIDAYSEGFEKGENAAKSESERKVKNAEMNLYQNQEIMNKFREASGLHMNTWTAGDIGRVVKLVLSSQDQVHKARNELARYSSILSSRIEEIDKILKEG